jgi:hypothetical protein
MGVGAGMPAGVDLGTGGVPTRLQAGGGWEESVYANAYNEDGWKEYNYLQVTWIVPSEPEYNDNNSFFALFPAIQLCTSSDDGCGSHGIVQPALVWNEEAYFPHAYSITTQAIQGSDFSPTVFEEVSVGDTIRGTISFQQAGEWTGYWFIEAEDTSSGAYVWQYWEPTASSYFWNAAYSGVLEAYGDQGEDAYPAYCDDLPASKSITFYVNAVEQFYYSESDYDVQVTPDFFGEANGVTPNGCDWSWTPGTQSGGPYNGDQNAILTW